jgi:hypothetical protein
MTYGQAIFATRELLYYEKGKGESSELSGFLHRIMPI